MIPSSGLSHDKIDDLVTEVDTHHHAILAHHDVDSQRVEYTWTLPFHRELEPTRLKLRSDRFARIGFRSGDKPNDRLCELVDML